MKEIIESIKKGYTGDNQKDTQYLLEQLEKYKDNQPVLKEIYKLLFELLPKDLQDSFIGQLNQQKFSERLDEIQELLVNGQNQRALDYLNLAIEHVKMVNEDDKFIYRTFHSPFEAYLYSKTREDNSKNIKNSELDFGIFYKYRGIALNNLSKYAEAEKDFLESFKWNNLDFEAIFGYATSLLKQNKLDEFYQFNLDTLKNSYTNNAIAHVYHNLGLYYMQKNTKNDDLLAYYLISYSISFAETENAFKDINTICEKYNLKKELAKDKDIFEALKENNIPTAPDFELIKFMVDTAKKFMGINDEFALYVFKLIYKLTHDEVTLAYIKQGEQVIAAKKNAN